MYKSLSFLSYRVISLSSAALSSTQQHRQCVSLGDSLLSLGKRVNVKKMNVLSCCVYFFKLSILSPTIRINSLI
jgi:hypothetical protein